MLVNKKYTNSALIGLIILCIIFFIVAVMTISELTIMKEKIQNARAELYDCGMPYYEDYGYTISSALESYMGIMECEIEFQKELNYILGD